MGLFRFNSFHEIVSAHHTRVTDSCTNTDSHLSVQTFPYFLRSSPLITHTAVAFHR